MTEVTKERAKELSRHLEFLGSPNIQCTQNPCPLCSDIGAILDDYSALKSRAEKAEAELAKQAPLIEAVMGAELWKRQSLHGLTEFSSDGEDAILCAALALREKPDGL